jgi:hypothetical protein|tara:strand:- start:801 stop:968 length:168 start_codon:yes stop_codon:yes gene_type:complete
MTKCNMKVHLKKLLQKDIEERKANYDVFVEVKETNNKKTKDNDTTSNTNRKKDSD